MKQYDLIVIGAGAAGMMAAITAAKEKKTVLLLEKLPKIAAKLKATGGGRCNLTNTLSNEEFMLKFGREGRFMTPALEALDHKKLQHFFHNIEINFLGKHVEIGCICTNVVTRLYKCLEEIWNIVTKL